MSVGARSAITTRVPRIIVCRPGPGFIHPAEKREVRAVLDAIGEEFTYGLNAVELRPGRRDGRPRFGRLVTPGRIIFFAQPTPPWTLAGTLRDTEVARLRRAGATIEIHGCEMQTTIDWPGDTLRDFVLLDVLPHELGHHWLQQYTGKRTTRVARTRDHEAAAERVARRLKARLVG